MQPNVALFENRSDLHREVLPAIVALPHADAGRFAAKLAAVIYTTAMWAYRTLRPEDAFQLCEGRGFIMEVGLVENAHRATPI
jgi:hypothetical protein